MQRQVPVVFRNMKPSPAVEARVKKHIAKIEKLFGRITGCRVVIAAPHRHHRKGKLFTVKVDCRVPGREIAVGGPRRNDHAHEDVYVALRDAFEALSRRLQDHARRRRGTVKAHAAPLHGTVARLFPEQGYGFIETSEGEDIYFHRNAVAEGGFARLKPGDRVRLAVVEGESAKGAQASTVHPPGRRRPRAAPRKPRA